MPFLIYRDTQLMRSWEVNLSEGHFDTLWAECLYLNIQVCTETHFICNKTLICCSWMYCFTESIV
jgi:hypothetical protein